VLCQVRWGRIAGMQCSTSGFGRFVSGHDRDHSLTHFHFLRPVSPTLQQREEAHLLMSVVHKAHINDNHTTHHDSSRALPPRETCNLPPTTTTTTTAQSQPEPCCYTARVFGHMPIMSSNPHRALR
jgi:hypothetical protein